MRWEFLCLQNCCVTRFMLNAQIPHEFGDFAILLKSGFDRYSQKNLKKKCAKKCALGGRQREHRSARHWLVCLAPSLLSPLRAATISRRCSCEICINFITLHCTMYSVDRCSYTIYSTMELLSPLRAATISRRCSCEICINLITVHRGSYTT